VDRYRAEIDRGLGESIATALLRQIDDSMGPPWEEAFRDHLRRLAADGRLGGEIVAVGPWWSTDGAVEIDAVALAGDHREVALVGEAKWAASVDGAHLTRGLERKRESLPVSSRPVVIAVCGRLHVRNAPAGILSITAADIFTP
jgi:hypothetical protein